MKTKKTIRKMTPLARKAAYLTRAMHSLSKRLDYLTVEIQRVEMENKGWEHAAAAACEGNVQDLKARIERENNERRTSN
jgi:hypothetical protein